MTKKRAKVVIENLENGAMYCPSCLTKLATDESFYYNDVCNQDIWSHKWYCPSNGFLNKKTGKFEQCLCHEYGTYWNDYGEFFSGSEYLNKKKIKFVFGVDTYAAFNSFAKKSETEIYKSGLPKKKYLHPIFCLWFLQPVIEYTYRSDEMGTILKSGWKMMYLKKDKHLGGGYHVVWTNPFRMFKFCIKQFKRNLKSYRKNPESKFNVGQLHKYFEKSTWDKRWWKTASRLYINTFYFRTKKIILKKYQKN